MSSSNGHQVSPSASSTLDSVEGATNETPSEVNDSDVNIAHSDRLMVDSDVQWHYLLKTHQHKMNISKFQCAYPSINLTFKSYVIT